MTTPKQSFAQNAPRAADLLIMPESTRALWPLFSEKTPEEFYREMTAGLPEGTKIELSLYPNGKLRHLIYLHHDDFCVQSGFDGNTAEYIYAHVHPNLRNQGLAQTVNRHLFRLYKQLGVVHVEINTMNIGVYAWARLGFAPDFEYWQRLRHCIASRLDVLEETPPKNDLPLPEEYIQKLRRALSSDDPKTFWFIVDQSHKYHGSTIGKLLTLPPQYLPDTPYKYALEQAFNERQLNMEWEGVLKMKDPDYAARLDAYLKQNKTARSCTVSNPPSMK